MPCKFQFSQDENFANFRLVRFLFLFFFIFANGSVKLDAFMCIACTEYAKGEIFARIYFCEGQLTCEICTQLYVVGTADSALIREMSSIQSVLYREVPL